MAETLIYVPNSNKYYRVYWDNPVIEGERIDSTHASFQDARIYADSLQMAGITGVEVYEGERESLEEEK